MLSRLLPRTLRARLTVLIVFSTSVILTISGVALFSALQSRLESKASEQMTNTLSALQSHLGDMRDVGEIPVNRAVLVDQLHGHRKMDLAISDLNGRGLITTRGFKSYPPIQAAGPGTTPLLLSREKSTLSYLVAVVSLAGATGPRVRVAVQYDRSSDLALLRSHAVCIIVIQLLGVVLAAGLAFGTALVGLSPLRRLAARAERMSSTGLAQPFADLHTSGELKELERAFNEMLHRLDESFTRLSQFSSNLAHDMRTPLTNLQAAAQVALSRPRSAADYRDVIESSIDEYRRLSRMIEDMLFLARSERVDASIETVRLDAAAEAERVANYYESMAEEAGVGIVVQGRAQVDADLLLYQRALSNLISNALRFAPRGSVIRVDCKASPDSTTIAVSDAGPGIDAVHIERIFERFYRVDPSRHNSAAGTGLGLAIVRSIMESHGGVCRVHSEPGVSTTFSLRFPRSMHGA
ncbi:histidine kinase [Caballeronia pedi]|uniref:Sensor protein n=1 Tax=Caballeronia pedi TaxID=1777141 RepID=A0A157ZGQ2_9BURK|nr:heavy metal sensor histidine kinase [Caballeronia pedi]SAK44673.1 histidine kinase [Caballeronia pedi]